MANDTLLIKHLPVQFSLEEKENFLKECGAIRVNVKYSKIKKYNFAFAQFPNPSMAERALYHLHQKEILGSYLVVEYAKIPDWTRPVTKTSINRLTPEEEGGTEALVKRFIEKLSRWVVGTDLRVPVPSHLRYHYPPPTPSTIRNIVRLLQTTPKLYTQVLHLINKMNLPCPIRDEPFPESVLHTPVSEFPLLVTESLNSESELSSGSEGQHKETIPKVMRKQKKPVKKRRLVKPVPTFSTSMLKQSIEEVFEDPRTLLDEPKAKKLKSSLAKKKDNSSYVASVHPVAEGFGLLQPVSKIELPEAKPVTDVRDPREEERLEKPKVDIITDEALSANRIAEKDRTLLPVFKNYAEGSPTCRIYIKNLAKGVTEEHLRFIYNRYLGEEYSENTNMFDIRLMQEGRMKGQAFVTLQTVDLAKKALAETNGFILLDKPMVVQFARSATK